MDCINWFQDFQPRFILISWQFSGLVVICAHQQLYVLNSFYIASLMPEQKSCISSQKANVNHMDITENKL